MRVEASPWAQHWQTASQSEQDPFCLRCFFTWRNGATAGARACERHAGRAWLCERTGWRPGGTDNGPGVPAVRK